MYTHDLVSLVAASVASDAKIQGKFGSINLHKVMLSYGMPNTLKDKRMSINMKKRCSNVFFQWEMGTLLIAPVMSCSRWTF
jgi:hypothetical protein